VVRDPDGEVAGIGPAEPAQAGTPDGVRGKLRPVGFGPTESIVTPIVVNGRRAAGFPVMFPA
jgi:hypothetical protein